MIKKLYQTSFCNLWATRYVSYNQPEASDGLICLDRFACMGMDNYLVVLPPPNLPGIQPVPHKLDTWLLLLKTRGLNCTSDCSVCIWQLSGSVWYFYSQCRAEQMSPVGTLCSSQLSHWAEGAAAAAAPARSACVLSYLGRRPHT